MAPQSPTCSEHNAWMSAPDTPGVEERLALIDKRRVYSLAAGSGEPVILVHGLLGTAQAWVGVMEQMSTRYRVYAADALGIGHSERLRRPDASLTQSADRLARWMDAEGLGSAHLVGTSHGGAVAMQFAAQFPSRVRRMVLHAPANPFSPQPQIRSACTWAGRLVAHAIPWAPSRFHQRAFEEMYGDPSLVRPEILKMYVRSLRVPGTVRYVLDVLRHWDRDMDALGKLLQQASGIPVLLLWGDRDRVVSINSAGPLGQALNAPLSILPGLGHLPFAEDPVAFAAPVIQFLGATGQRPADGPEIHRDELAADIDTLRGKVAPALS